MAKTKTTKKRFDPETVIQSAIVDIDAQLEIIERRMAPYAKLAETKSKLLASRRALMGTGNRNTGNAGTRLTVDDVLAYFKKHPGNPVSALAEEFGVTQSTVSSHIYRNKELFIKKNGGYYARDPEAGIDTADDIEEDDE